MPNTGKIDKSMPVLVVDDSSAMRRIVKNCLKQLGFEHVDEAEDGDIALGKLSERKFSMVICDCNMPNMRGVDVLRAVRSDHDLAAVPFVMLATEGQKEDLKQASEAGASNFVFKPVTAAVLGSKIEAIFEAGEKGKR